MTKGVDKVYGYCFGCHEKPWSPLPEMTPQERRAQELAAEAFQALPPTLPADMTSELPSAAVLWLSVAGLNHYDILRHGFGYSPKMDRVIMPVYRDGELVAVQARALRKGQIPKYLGQVKEGPRPVFVVEAKEHCTGLVLTEDMLSAARVGKVNDAWALLGTNLSPATLSEIMDSHYDDIYIWMDDDPAGWAARRKIKKALQLAPQKVHLIKSDRDPKKHSLEEIQALIGKD